MTPSFVVYFQYQGVAVRVYKNGEGVSLSQKLSYYVFVGQTSQPSMVPSHFYKTEILIWLDPKFGPGQRLIDVPELVWCVGDSDSNHKPGPLQGTYM